MMSDLSPKDFKKYQVAVRTSYDFAMFPEMDDRLYEAVGRPSCFSGSNLEGRDNGWVCQNEFEVAKVRAGIKLVGLAPRIDKMPIPDEQLPADNDRK